MRENRTLRLTWRGLETWPWWNCEPTLQSKERDWKPSTYRRRACPRSYLEDIGQGELKEVLIKLDGPLHVRTEECHMVHPAGGRRGTRGTGT